MSPDAPLPPSIIASKLWALVCYSKLDGTFITPIRDRRNERLREKKRDIEGKRALQMGMTHLLAGAYRPKTGRCCSPHSSTERKDRYAALTIHYLILKMKGSIPSEWPLDWCVRYSFNLVSSQKAKFGLGNCRVQVPWQSHSLIKFLISDTSLIILLKHEFLWKVVFFF